MHRNPDDELLGDDDRRTVDVLRRIGPEDAPGIDPPPEVWAGIVKAIRAESAAKNAGRPNLQALPGGAAPMRARRAWKVAAVAAAIALIALGSVAVMRNGTPSRSEVVASARLGIVADGAAGTGRGAAQLVRRADGTHLLVEVDEMQATDRADFFELWLLNRTNGDPQSLGRMTEKGPGTLDVVVPDGVSTAQFPVVDISSEVDDGDASHSGRSVLRGTLT